MKTMGKFGCMFVLSTMLVSGIGCGSDLPKLGTVSGTVTMDGEPAPNLIVEFHSAEGGRAGVGVTDEEGNYELKYRGDDKGTKVGMNTVYVTTEWPDGEPGDGETEPIPPQYSGKSILKFDVKPGSNTIDLPLKSDGSPVN